MVEHLSDEDLRQLPRGGHDYRKLYAAYKAATEHKGQPTVILAKTVKGWTLGADVEARNSSHQIKKLGRDNLFEVRERLHLEDLIPDAEIEDGDPLLDALRLPPSGEPRVPFFYPRIGGEVAFAAAFRERFGATHALLTINEVDELRLLGPDAFAPETRRRMGEFMAISATPDAIQHKPDDPMLGYHGGLLSDEMRIPLIVV